MCCVITEMGKLNYYSQIKSKYIYCSQQMSVFFLTKIFLYFSILEDFIKGLTLLLVAPIDEIF